MVGYGESKMSRISSFIAILVVALIGCVGSAFGYGMELTQDGDQAVVDLVGYDFGDEMLVESYNLSTGMTLEVTRQPVSGQLYSGESLVTDTFSEGCGCGDSVEAWASMDVTEGSLIAIKNGAITLVSFNWKESYDGQDLRVRNDGSVEILDAMG